jgi:pimeloyl-ACP methyl ester carboxylesterase
MTATAQDTDRFVDLPAGPRICHRVDGPDDGTPLLLVAGLGLDLTSWPQRMVDGFVERGFRVVRLDNRDAGRSSRIDAPPPGRLRQLLARPRPDAYDLADMAADTVGLLDALGIERAHLVGMSMGGMIAQTVAARHPSRVRSLTSIMSNTGARFSGQPALKTFPVLLGAAPTDRESFIEHGAKTWTLIGSPGFERDELELREMIALSFDRGASPAGTARQLGAIIASGDRRRELRAVQAPTLVIHGEADKLVSPSGGRATAKAIQGARLITIPGMGHDLPRPAWPQIIGAIADHAHAADEATGDEPAVRAA